ncbi:hypothetical protein HDV04_003128 [Boothiomyces sp. JEL0838]|nr:hypothetical protein HDV04_003128 [Boothiomyces sp. JEL0838]
MSSFEITLIAHQELLNIYKFPPDSPVPDLDGFLSVTRTRDELSVVTCHQLQCEKKELNFNYFQVKGELDFSLIGILARISEILKNGGISIFVISTFDTDYVLVRDKDHQRAMDLFRKAGIKIQV